MIDSVALVWGSEMSSPPRRARGVPMPESRPLELDVRELHERFAVFGPMTVKEFEPGKTSTGGHWKFAELELLYSDAGRLEVRASLPRVITGDLNDVVLDERGVHDALRELARRAGDLIGRPLDLRAAVPARIDSVIQWEVPSVAWCCEHLKSCFHPARKVRTEYISPKGGRSVIWGYKSKRVLRFYDKGAEVAEKRAREISHNIPKAELEQMSESERQRAISSARRRAREQTFRDANVDTTLRFEVQDRRRQALYLIHENGWRALDVRRELERALVGLAAVKGRDFAAVLDSYNPDYPNRVAYAAGSLYFAEHPDALAVVRTRVSRRAYYDWRRRAAQVALAVADWAPIIPGDAFESNASFWKQLEEAA